MPRRAALILASAACALLGWSAAATAAVIGFDDLPAGTRVGEQ